MKIVFIILNYNTYRETIDCISSIECKIDTDAYQILVVDNASQDGSAEKLAEYVKSKEKVELIVNDNNLGFARGNNVGIQYANRNYRPEYMVVLNSDTELIQSDLVKKLEKEYSISEFALLGPMILTANGRCDNSPDSKPTKKRIEAEIKKLKFERKLKIFYLFKIYCAFNFFKGVVRTKILKSSGRKARSNFSQYQRQVVVQGSFLVFSQKAFDYIKGFDESTFLYYEEPILYMHLIRAGLNIVYNPEICIYHKDGISTKKMKKTNRKLQLFINQCYIDSAGVLLELLEKEG